MFGKIDVLISSEEIEKRVMKLAEEISNDYKEKAVVFVCILKGSIIFTAELCKKLSIEDVEIEFMTVSSYGNDTKSSGTISIDMDLCKEIGEKNIIILEDIIDTGRTLKYLVEHLKSKNPKTLKLCTLLDKPSRRLVDVEADYVGFTIPDEFVVGYGLDYAQKFRNLPYIGVLNQE